LVYGAGDDRRRRSSRCDPAPETRVVAQGLATVDDRRDRVLLPEAAHEAVEERRKALRRTMY
jgi:hypothetical protein